MQRRCASCHGPVYSSKATITIADSEGNIHEFQGLGTWKCVNGCKPRTVSIPTYTGAGKESERGSASRGHNLIHGMDLADEAITIITRRRPIAVLTPQPKH